MQQVAHKVWTSVYQERTSAFALTDGCSGSLCNRATQDSYVSTLNTKRLNFYRGQIASARIDICSSNNNNIKTPGVDTVFNLLFSFFFFFFDHMCRRGKIFARVQTIKLHNELWMEDNVQNL